MSKPVVVYMIEGYTGYCSDDGNVNWGIFSTDEEARKELEYLNVVYPEYDLDIVEYEVYEKSSDRRVIVRGTISVGGRVLSILLNHKEESSVITEDFVKINLSRVVPSSYIGSYVVEDGETASVFRDRVIGIIQQEYKQLWDRSGMVGEKI